MKTKRISLKPGREKSLINRHPWVFSGAIGSRDKGLVDGDLVAVCAADGRFLGQGYYNGKSEIAARILSWDPAEAIDRDFFFRRLSAALTLRTEFIQPEQTDAYRLIYAESDGLPGCIIDRYAGQLVIQINTLGMETCKESLLEALRSLFPHDGMIEKSDSQMRGLEGLEPCVRRIASGTKAGADNAAIEIRENGLPFLCELMSGHKTGFYLDQRENRQFIASFAPDRSVLNAFSYTGGFGAYCLAHGAAKVTNLDISGDALALAERNMRLQLARNEDRASLGEWENVQGDAFEVLRRFHEQRPASFDLVILDPPKFVQNQKRLHSALRGYKDINRIGMSLVKPGGYFATFSCSGHVSEDLFQKVVFGAAVDAKRTVQVTRRLNQAMDHPLDLYFPESLYLKGLFGRVI